MDNQNLIWLTFSGENLLITSGRRESIYDRGLSRESTRINLSAQAGAHGTQGDTVFDKKLKKHFRTILTI